MNWLKKIFGIRRNPIMGFNPDKQSSFDEFMKLPVDKRMTAIMDYGNTGDLKYYPLLKYALLNDPNQNVKFSALKRIHLFKSDPDCIAMLTDLENQFNTRSLEPYYSMALSKTGIITLAEFEKRINNS